MERIGFKTKVEKARILVRNILTTISLIFSLLIGFFIGYQYHIIKTKTETPPPKSVEILLKKNMNLALDERNNIILINRENGSCLMFEDSLGYSIFNAYAKRILTK